MVNAHKADAMVCISNCDKITPGMLMAAMRLNIPTVFVHSNTIIDSYCIKLRSEASQLFNFRLHLLTDFM